MRDLLSIEAILTLNEAFCEHHRDHCAPDISPEAAELLAQCDVVDVAAEELRKELYRVSLLDGDDELCQDKETSKCTSWKAENQCISNAGA